MFVQYLKLPSSQLIANWKRYFSLISWKLLKAINGLSPKFVIISNKHVEANISNTSVGHQHVLESVILYNYRKEPSRDIH